MTDYRKNGGALGGSGMANPMTTAGDIIVGGVAGAPARLAIGTGGYVLRAVAGTPGWREVSAAGLLAARLGAAAVREGQTYWATDAAAGQQLSICLHQGGVTYAWEILPYGGPGLPVAGGAGEVPISTGAGTTYAASPFSTEVGTAVGGFIGGTAGQTFIGDGGGGVATTSADVSGFLVAADAAAARAAIGLASSTPVAPTCVSRWLLDGTGSTITDSVGSANLAYSGSAANQRRPSPWGASLYTGVLSTGECPKGATALEPAAVTVLAWIKTFSYTLNPLIVFKRQDDATWSGASPTNAVIAISTQSNGLPYAYACAGTSVPLVYPSGLEKRFPLDIWCRVAVAYSAAAGLLFYIDGQLVGSAAADGALLYANHGSWGIGVNNGGSGVSSSQVFDGFVRDVQVCNSVLTATQILADYQQGVGTYEAP